MKTPMTAMRKTTIEKYRKERRLTQAALAALVGKSTARICEYEKGDNVPLGTLWAIAAVLHIPTGDLFEDQPSTGAPASGH